MSSLNMKSSRAPELEHEYLRDATGAYEPQDTYGFIRYLEHGFPNSLVRWHYHEEYELHLIAETSGQAFVGDYIGSFAPGHLVLTGPRLPHNWISSDCPPQGVPVRDMLIQFPHAPLQSASESIPELRDLMPLLERSRRGIEFFGLAEVAKRSLTRIRDARGVRRFAEFMNFMEVLVTCNDYRLLSSGPARGPEDNPEIASVSAIVGYVTEACEKSVSLADIAKKVGMTESAFSRYFHRTTGNTFKGFVNGLRINKACRLLTDTDLPITSICFEVGFNNVANFNRRFLKLKGVSPREYRRQSELRYGRVAS